MTPSRPYLIRAIYQWITDNELTPYLLVNTQVPGVIVPEAYVENNKIILNTSPVAVQGLVLGNEEIEFSARFGGVVQTIVVPSDAVLAIYARENGQGMVFNEEQPASGKKNSATDSNPPNQSPKKHSKPNLRVVK